MTFEINGKTFNIGGKEAIAGGIVTTANAASFYAMYKLVSTGFDVIAMMSDKKLTKPVIRVGGRLIAAAMGADTMGLVSKAGSTLMVGLTNAITDRVKDKEDISEAECDGDSCPIPGV